MAKTDNPAEQPGVTQPVVATDFPLTLHEFCTRLSASDRRVELIGGFEHAERVAGRVKDTDANYGARFTAFINAPA